MDKREARMILRQHLVAWRSRSWSDLRAMIGEAQVLEADGPSGTRYTVEGEASWDGKPEGDIRALASIDDGGWGAARARGACHRGRCGGSRGTFQRGGR